jgi:hypothetical protein
VLPVFEQYRDSKLRADQSPVTWALSRNIHRRHLDASQRAQIGAELIGMYERESKERQRQGGREKVPAKLPEAGEAREKAADAVGVSGRLVSDAIVVKREGSPEVAAAVTSGAVSVSAAARSIRANRSGPAARRRRTARLMAPPSMWSVPWPIPDMAAVIRKLRSSADVDELVRLLSAGGA